MSGHPILPSDPITLPLLPLRDVVVFPHMVIPLFVGRPKSIKELEAAMESGRQIMLVAQKAASKDEPKADDMFDVGCVSSILQMLKLPDGTVKVLVEGLQRATTRKMAASDVAGFVRDDALELVRRIERHDHARVHEDVLTAGHERVQRRVVDDVHLHGLRIEAAGFEDRVAVLAK